MVDSQQTMVNQSSASGLGTRAQESPPFFCGNPIPHPLWDGICYGNGDQTIWPYCLSTWPYGQRIVKWYQTASNFELWFSVPVLRSSHAVGFAWIWIGVSFLQLGRQCSMSGKTCHVGVTSVAVHLHLVKAYAHKTWATF